MRQTMLIITTVTAITTIPGIGSAATCDDLRAPVSFDTYGSCTGSGTDNFGTFDRIVGRAFADEGVVVTREGSFAPMGDTGDEFTTSNRSSDGFASSGFGSRTIEFSSLPENTIFVSLKQGREFELFPILSDLPFSLTHSLTEDSISHVTTLAGTGPRPSPIPLPAAGWLVIAGIGGLAALGRRRRAA